MSQQLPLKLLCSSKFSRYDKMSSEEVYNLFIADGWLINTAGYEKDDVDLGDGTGEGRGIFYSSRANRLFVVADSTFYEISATGTTLSAYKRFTLTSSTGAVYMDENLKNQIAVCDGRDIWIYDYSRLPVVSYKLELDFIPGYVTFQDGRFIASSVGRAQWRLSDFSLLSFTSNTMVNAGAGYAVNDILTVVGGDGTATIKVLTKGGSGEILTYEVLTPGDRYSSGTHTTTVAPAGGTGATFKPSSGFTPSSGQVGSFQTKPDNVKACVRVPGKTGQILIMGNIVTEVWTDLGLQVFPYQRNSGYSIEYGCLSTETIGAGDDFVAWLGANEKSGPVIMLLSGNGVNQISTDGINFRLSELEHPEESFGFIYKQDGHVFYQITFTHASDNVTYIYDFNTQKFYTLTDTKQSHHIARRVAFFNNSYFFISEGDNNLYRLDSNIDTYDGAEIPRTVITNGSGLPDRKPFVVNSVTFPIEQGENKELARVDLSTSSDGGVTFGNKHGIELNAFGKRRNILKYYNLGRYNEITLRFDFWSFDRFVLQDGVADIT